jgi:hypothetical protein
VIPQVAEAEGIDARLLYPCMQFYDAFPKVGVRPPFEGSQYCRLMQIGHRPLAASIRTRSIFSSIIGHRFSWRE